MNKEIEKYKKKFNKLIKTIKLLGISIFFLGVLISIVQYTINKSKSSQEEQNIDSQSTNYSIDLQENAIVYQNNFDMNLNINEFEEQSNYKIIIKCNDEIVIEQDITNQQTNYNIKMNYEGAQNIAITIYKNNEENYNKIVKIFYVKPYEKQFLDELYKVGANTHYVDNSWEKYTEDKELLFTSGIKVVRDSIKWSSVDKGNGVYDFSKYDAWVQEVLDNNINIIFTIAGIGNKAGDDQKINSQEELESLVNFVMKVIEHYPNLYAIEMFNEPNIRNSNYAGQGYTTDEYLDWYAKVVEEINKKFEENNIKTKLYSGANAVLIGNVSGVLDSYAFFRELSNRGVYKNSNGYSYHPYDWNVVNQQSGECHNLLKNHKTLFNELGGFIKNEVTEFGISAYEGNGVTEDVQSQKNIQNAVIMNQYDVESQILYNLWNKSNDSTTREANFGLLYNNYTPKPSYYAMKNYYQNTNGSEYIGTINIQDGLESHVYNKDGNPIIIAWSDNTDNTYNFTLNEMTAKDLYGKDLVADQNGQIQITTSPVYLYNVSDNYFYQAISNTTTQKYDEFTEKFQDQITKVQGLQATIENLKQRMNDLSTTSSLNETTAINLMKQHYNLGNTIMQAYQSGSLQIEYVTLSSMLDMLDDIGDSFEDLVTVSATTRNTNLSETLTAITNAENLINDDDIEMVYPAKILEFSQDFYDTANYINSLDEENDIKTGLIVSKNLHGQLLANWAQEFAKLYINEYIASNPVEIVYSTTELTNKDVTATLQTNANITVTNNSNRKTYTFYQNGDFTFEYTIKGQAFTKTAVVANIDKTSPKITNVENDKLYTNEVSPQIQDENLQEVKLYKDSNLLQNYSINSVISEDGNYKLVAIDKATNQTEIEFYISRNPASITYSETELTNQNVIASITSNFDVQVTNNANNPQYTFTQNGSFTFQFKIKGTTLNLTATVNNIDKEKPVITGVEQNKQYLEKAIPNVTDDHLKSVELYLNSVKVEGYTPGKELSEEGFYKIVATDQAGNETTVEFMVLEKISEEYKFQDNYVLNIEHSTKREDFEEKLNPYMKYQIIRNGKELTKQDVIATGDKLKTSAGGEYTLIVKGDINKDGEVNVQDIVKLRIYILTKRNLDEEAKLAADCNVDGKEITVKDLVRLRLIVLTKGIV